MTGPTGPTGAGTGTYTGEIALVYQPSGPTGGASKGIFNSWAALYAVAQNVTGPLVIAVDQSYGPPTVPAGSYNLGLATRLISLNPSTLATITFQQGVTLTSPPLMENINVVNNATSTTPVVLGVGSFALSLSNGATLSSVHTPFIAGVTGTTLNLNLGNTSQILNGGSVVASGMDTINVGLIGNGASVANNTLDANVAINGEQYSSSSTIGTIQSPTPTVTPSGTATGAVVFNTTGDIQTTGLFLGSAGTSSTVALAVQSLTGSGGTVSMNCNDLTWESGLTPSILYGGTNRFTINVGGDLDLIPGSGNLNVTGTLAFQGSGTVNTSSGVLNIGGAAGIDVQATGSMTINASTGPIALEVGSAEQIVITAGALDFHALTYSATSGITQAGYCTISIGGAPKRFLIG